MKVITIIGARPQFIKAAVLSRAFKESRPDISEIIVHTGQHYDINMSQVFFDELDIPLPDYNLEIGGGSQGQNTGRMIEKLEGLIMENKPDWVLVYGDTNSTLAGALAAAKLHIPVAHVEAGLRSFNRRMPEEINRVLTDHIADLLFVPTSTGRRNLINEGIPEDKIKLVGDVMYDATRFYAEKARRPSLPDGFKITKDGFILCTIHRAENTNDVRKLKGIFRGLSDSGKNIILPMHPRTKATIEKLDISISKNIHVISPVGYLEMAWLEANCTAIATDSGGVQKEAYFHGKPCITLRDETEWVELVESGWNVLVGSNSHDIADALINLRPGAKKERLYGDGNAAKIICGELRC